VPRADHPNKNDAVDITDAQEALDRQAEKQDGDTPDEGQLEQNLR
jgi:hypothetical protein